MAHQVELEQPWRGLARLVRMAVKVIEEALVDDYSRYFLFRRKRQSCPQLRVLEIAECGYRSQVTRIGIQGSVKLQIPPAGAGAVRC
jgi:hypothetical protein